MNELFIETYPGCEQPAHREGIIELMLAADPPAGGVFRCGCMFVVADAPSALGSGVGTRKGKRR